MKRYSTPNLSAPQPVQVDDRGRVLCDGVPIGYVVRIGGRCCLSVVDKDRRRSSERGTREVLVDLSSLANVQLPAERIFPDPPTPDPEGFGLGSLPAATD